MGQSMTMTRLGQMTAGKETLAVSVVGVGFSGKTTIIHHLKTGRFLHRHNQSNSLKAFLNLTESGFQTKIVLCQFLLRANGIVFVVDSNDRERIVEAKDVLHSFLNKEEAKDKPLLVIANKQDLPNAMSVYEITEKLDLHALCVRCWESSEKK